MGLLWLTGLGHWLCHQHPIFTPVQVLPGSLPIQVLVHMLKKAANDGSSVWTPPILMGDGIPVPHFAMLQLLQAFGEKASGSKISLFAFKLNTNFKLKLVERLKYLTYI